MKRLNKIFDAAFALHSISHPEDKAEIVRQFIQALKARGGSISLEDGKALIFDLTAASV